MSEMQLENSQVKLRKLAAALCLQDGGIDVAIKPRAGIDRAGTPSNVISR